MPVSSASQAFIDESGGIDQPVLVLGGWVGSSEMWSRFAEDWQAVLNSPPQLPAFHMVEFECAKRGFEAMANPKRKKQKLDSLVSIIEKHRPQGFISIVDIHDFKKRVTYQRSREPWRYPYEFAACNLVGSLCSLHEAVGGVDFGRVDVAFDYMVQFRNSTREKIERSVRGALEADDPRLARRLGDVRWIRPKDRFNYVPLQAADMLVWHQRRARAEDDGKHRVAWRRLKALNLKYAGSSDQLRSTGRDALDVWIRGHLDEAQQSEADDLTP